MANTPTVKKPKAKSIEFLVDYQLDANKEKFIAFAAKGIIFAVSADNSIFINIETTALVSEKKETKDKETKEVKVSFDKKETKEETQITIPISTVQTLQELGLVELS